MKFILCLLLAILLSVFGNAQTWYQANNPFGGLALVLHETESGALLCGTGRGLYKSVNNGESWQPISGELSSFSTLDATSTPSGMYIALFGYTLRRSYDQGQNWETLPPVDWTSLNIIVVNAQGHIFLNTNNSIWRSTDEGDNWTQLSIAENVSSASSLAISPDGELYAGSFNGRVFRSSNNGDTWEELFTADNDIRSFAFDGDDVVYGSTSFSGVYKSTNNGDDWEVLPALPGTNGAFELAVNDAGHVYAAPYDGGVIRSEDGGMSWIDLSSDLIDTGVRTLFVDSGDELFIGTEAAGVQILDGSDWLPKNQGLSAIFIERFVSIDGVLYACSDAGVFISEDGGTSWQQSLRGMDDKEIVAVAKAPNGDLYAGGEMLYRSEDGVNWENISSGFPDSEVTATDILVESDGRVILATDEYGIRYSDNLGQNWTNANTGLEDVTMNFIRSNSSGVLFTSDAINLYRSSNLSGAWEIINTGLDDGDIEDFAVGENYLFALTYSDGLFRSIDNGDNWTLANEEDFNNVTLNGSEVYASSLSILDGGVFFSDDNGNTWNNIVGDLPNIQIEGVHYVDGLGLFANVSDFGLYTLDFSVLGINENTSDHMTSNCFPNPFSDSAILRIELTENTEVSAFVFDTRGQLVERVGARNLSGGTHDLRIGSGLKPGIYLVQVSAGDQFRIIRLLKAG